MGSITVCARHLFRGRLNSIYAFLSEYSCIRANPKPQSERGYFSNFVRSLIKYYPKLLNKNAMAVYYYAITY